MENINYLLCIDFYKLHFKKSPETEGLECGIMDTVSVHSFFWRIKFYNHVVKQFRNI